MVNATKNTETLLSIRNLSVYYGSAQALKNVSLDVRSRGITALMGPSGCGKSTLLRALNRMHALYDNIRVEGQAILNSHQVDVLDEKIPSEWVRSTIGMVFQKPNPFPKSILENVAFGLKVQGNLSKSEREARIEEALQAAGLWNEVKDRLHANALELSGGQQQRLCIARALAPRPQILLMDEPTSALDPISTQLIEALIKDLSRDTCIVLVTHNMQQAQRISHQLAFLYLGEILEKGSTQEVFAAPHHENTRRYIQGALG
jgi:phosphate transport system ATP-binding protein